jgi:FeS assembly SUF system protein
MENEEALKQKIVDCLETIFDPEIPVSIYSLGLIYNIEILPINNVQITMTLTSPSCPAAQSLPPEVEEKVKLVEGVNDAHVMVTWTPTWDKSMMSEAAALELGFM